MQRAIAQVAPLIVESYDPLVLLSQARAAVRALTAGTRLRVIVHGQSQDGAALVVTMAAEQRACPPSLHRYAAAWRDWYRTQMAQTYVPDVRHYLVIEAPDRATLDQLRDDVAASLGLDIVWLEGEERGIVDAPEVTAESPDGIRVGDRYAAARAVERLPARVRLGWIRPLLALRFPYRIAVTIEGRDQWAEQARLTDRLEQITLITDQHRDVPMRAQATEVEGIIDGLAAGTTTVVGFGLCATTWAATADALAGQVQDVEAALRAMGCGVRRGRYDQARLAVGDMPLYRTTDVVAGALYPWQRPAPGHSTGLIVGEAGGALVRYDQSKAMTGIIAIVGQQGSGKSVLGQFMALQTLLAGQGVTIIDSSGSWRGLVEAAGGVVLRVDAGEFSVTDAAVLNAPAVLLDTAGQMEAADYATCKRVVVNRVLQWQAHGSQCRVYIDEGWGLIKAAGAWVQEIGRKARHADMHLTLLTQNLSDALDDPDGVKFFTAIPCAFLMRTVDERIGHGSGLGWIDRVYGAGTAEIIAGLRRLPDRAEAYMVERDPTRAVLQRAVINVRVPRQDRVLFGSYRLEREERARAVAAHRGSVVDAVLALADA